MAKVYWFDAYGDRVATGITEYNQVLGHNENVVWVNVDGKTQTKHVAGISPTPQAAIQRRISWIKEQIVELQEEISDYEKDIKRLEEMSSNL